MFILPEESRLLMEINKEQAEEFAVGTKVTCRFMPGSNGSVIEVELPSSLVFGPRFRVLWHQVDNIELDDSIESGPLRYSELRRID